MKIRNKIAEQTPEQEALAKKYKALDDLARRAGFDDDALAHTEFSLLPFFELIIEEAAKAAELHSRSYSDGDAGTGCYGAANAVRAYGKNLGENKN